MKKKKEIMKRNLKKLKNDVVKLTLIFFFEWIRGYECELKWIECYCV